MPMKSMTKAVFLERAAEVLDVASVSETTRFRELPGWCSLQAFGLLVLLENGCGVPMDLARFGTFQTLGELYDAC